MSKRSIEKDENTETCQKCGVINGKDGNEDEFIRVNGFGILSFCPMCAPKIKRKLIPLPCGFIFFAIHRKTGKRVGYRDPLSVMKYFEPLEPSEWDMFVEYDKVEDELSDSKRETIKIKESKYPLNQIRDQVWEICDLDGGLIDDLTDYSPTMLFSYSMIKYADKEIKRCKNRIDTLEKSIEKHTRFYDAAEEKKEEKENNPNKKQKVELVNPMVDLYLRRYNLEDVE